MNFMFPYAPESVAVEDDIQYQIEDSEGMLYLQRVLSLIVNKEGVVIGEMTGYILNTDAIFDDLTDSFFVMDGISQLLCNAHTYIVENEHIFLRETEVLYLNRLTLYDEHHNYNLEGIVLNSLINIFGTIIYSFGITELTDSDFPIHQNEFYFKYWQKELIKTDWIYNDTFGFYLNPKKSSL